MATAALVLVVPVVVGVTRGGFVAGLIATAIGFLVYDLVFIPPYYTLSVGATQNWVALAVYVVVMLVLAQGVNHLHAARALARIREIEARRLFDVSELLVREATLQELLPSIVEAVDRAFEPDGVALLMPNEGSLELAASVGAPLSEAELAQLSSRGLVPVALESGMVRSGGVQAVALVASGQALGLLALRGLKRSQRDRDLLRTFANHLALALERAQLSEQAVRVQSLVEVDRLRRALVGAVSHDFRTPLATIKVSTSTLLDVDAPVSERAAVDNLVRLIDVQADRLNAMVTNVLDMTRIQSGALDVRREPVEVGDLVDEARAVLGSLPDLERVSSMCPSDLPFVDADPVLIRQVLANLIDNATRHAPGTSPITVTARSISDDEIEVSVADRGPGVPKDELTTIFQMFNRREAGGRGGLGLAIAQSFVEAHGGRIWVENGDREGARFAFTLPVAAAGRA